MSKDKPLAQKLDERVFEELLKYNPHTQNLWDIVGVFEHEREKLRRDVAQYLEDIKNSQAKLKELREQIKSEQHTLQGLQQTIASSPQQEVLDDERIKALELKIAELELENSTLRVEIRDLKSEYELTSTLQNLHKGRVSE